ncbi:hypothetical protein [Burkholderia glumae]|uniref:hypothetical protein n=1 Tax=Burkholderia glumae TaxID=337 RepID=UPI0021509B14|nr:hypothetical protein [Burkholderia glumae]UVS93500.1 hypothetical protein EFP17_28410 [Burkholderia glumae]
MKLMIARGSQLIIDAMPTAFDLHGSATVGNYEIPKVESAAQRLLKLNVKIGKMTATQFGNAVTSVCDKYDKLESSGHK